MVTSPAVSWLFFKARAKRPYLSHTGRASNAEKQPTGPGPEGCVENGPAAALLVGYVSIQICALLAPCRRPILNATTSPLYARRYTMAEEGTTLKWVSRLRRASAKSASENLQDWKSSWPSPGRFSTRSTGFADPGSWPFANNSVPAECYRAIGMYLRCARKRPGRGD